MAIFALSSVGITTGAVAAWEFFPGLRKETVMALLSELIRSLLESQRASSFVTGGRFHPYFLASIRLRGQCFVTVLDHAIVLGFIVNANSDIHSD